MIVRHTCILPSRYLGKTPFDVKSSHVVEITSQFHQGLRCSKYNRVMFAMFRLVNMNLYRRVLDPPSRKMFLLGGRRSQFFHNFIQTSNSRGI